MVEACHNIILLETARTIEVVYNPRLNRQHAIDNGKQYDVQEEILQPNQHTLCEMLAVSIYKD